MTEVYPVFTGVSRHTACLAGDGSTKQANFVLCQTGKPLCCEQFTQTWR